MDTYSIESRECVWEYCGVEGEPSPLINRAQHVAYQPLNSAREQGSTREQSVEYEEHSGIWFMGYEAILKCDAAQQTLSAK